MSYTIELCSISASYLLEFVSMYDMEGNGPNPHAGRKGLVFEDTASDLSFSTDLLTKLDLIKPANGVCWICLVDKDQTLSFLRQRGLADAERVQVVGEYLMTLCEWIGVPTTRNDFVLPAKAGGFRSTLVDHGLCVQHGKALRWRDCAGLAMRSAKQWDADGRSIFDIESQATMEESERIWRLLPPSTKDMLLRQTNQHSKLVIHKLMSDHWDGEIWERRPSAILSSNIELANALLALVLRKQTTRRVAAIPVT